jgi:hypothetical protein
MIIEAACSSETLMPVYQSTRHRIPEERLYLVLISLRKYEQLKVVMLNKSPSFSSWLFTVTSIWVLYLYREGTALSSYFTLSSSIHFIALLLIKTIYRICYQRSFEELFPGSLALFSFINADFGLFFLCVCSTFSFVTILWLFWRSTLSHCLNVSIPSHFNILPLFTLSVICMLILTHHFFHLILECVPKDSVL